MRRVLFVLAALVAAAFAISAFFDPDRLRPQIRSSLERSLRRNVDLNGTVEFDWLPSPRLTITDVVIHDDASMGLEPLAYVTALNAAPQWLSLLAGRVEFSSLTLDEPSVNVRRTDNGGLNVAPFLTGLTAARDVRANLPEIRVRDGRLNFVQGLRKSVYYLTALDMTLRPVESSGFQVSVATEVARTDRPPTGYGAFTAQGRLRLLVDSEPEIDLTLDLERSPLADVLLLFEGRRSNLTGRISSRAKVTGPLSALRLDGRVDLEGFQRWRLPGIRNELLTLFYAGEASLTKQSLRIQTVAGPNKTPTPMQVRLRAAQAFSQPRWGVVAAVEAIPVVAVKELAGALGLKLDERFESFETATGAVGASSSEPEPRGGFLFAKPETRDEILLVPDERDKPASAVPANLPRPATAR